MAQPSWDSLREERDRLLRDQKPRRGDDDYAVLLSTVHDVVCPDCGKAGALGVSVSVEDVRHVDRDYPHDNADDDEMADYESGIPTWGFSSNWREREPGALDVDMLAHALSEIRRKQITASARVERLAGYEQTIQALLESAEQAPKPTPSATEPPPPDRLIE